MSLTWISKDESLHHNGRFFHDGDKVPAGLLSKDRLSYFIREGKIKSDEPEIKEVKNEEPVITESKRGRKPNAVKDEEPEKSDDDGELK